MSVTRAVQGALSVRPQEGRLVLLLLVHSFFVGIPRVLTSTAAMALFLAHFDATELPYVYMAAAIAIPVSGFFRLTLANRLSLGRLLAVDLVFVFVALLAFRAALMSPWVVLVAMVLPVWAEVEWVVLNLEFWGLAGHLMNVRQAKRLFGLIGAGELAAGGLVGFLVPAIVERLGTSNLLLLSAGSVVGCGVLLGLISRSFALQPAPAPRPEDRVERRPRYAELLRSRYLGLIFALVAVSYFGYYVVDNAFYGLAQDQYPNEDHLASFLGIFWAVASLITLLSRALATSRLLTRYGLVGGLLALPLAVALGATLVAASGVLAAGLVVIFWCMTFTKLVDQTLRESVDRSAILVLYQPLPARQRVRAQTAVEGILGPVAGGVAGLALLLLLRVLHFGIVHLAGLLLLLVAAWATVAWVLRHEYAKVLAKALASRRLSGVVLTLEDASSVAVLQNGLSSLHPGEVLYCLNTLEELGHPSFESSLLELVKHPAAEVRREALLRLERLRLGSALGVVRLAVVEEEDASVRSAAIRALTAVGEPEDLDKAIACLDDPDAEIRLGAMAGLLRNGGIEGVLIAGERLMDESRAEQASRRSLVARLIGEVGVSSFHRPLLSLLEDEDVGVRRAALMAAAQIKNPRLWPLALDALAEPQLRSLAMAALVAGGDGVVGLLEGAYGAAERAGDRPGQRRTVRLCSQIRGPRAADLLWRKTDCPDGEVRHSILSSLLLIGFKADTDQAQIVRERIVNEVSEAAGILAAIGDLTDGEALDLVTGTLEHALERSRERIFCLLAFVYPADSIFKARVNLSSRYPDKRAQAVELIDSLLPLETAHLFVPLIEDIPNAERLERLSTRFPQDRYGREERLRRLIEQADDSSPWERASAIHAAGVARLDGLEEAVGHALEDPSPLVRETAAWARARLAPREQRSPVYGREAEALVARFVEELEGRRQGVAPMLSTVEKVIILKSVSIFSETPDEILAEVASLLEEVEVEAGERIFEKGDMGSAMYIVVEGGVRVHNQDRTLRELGPRDIFGEMAALDPEPRSASITALAATHLFRLEQEALYELMADRIEVVRGVISVLCQRLRAITS